MDAVTVTRIGTQVVVRLAGDIGDATSDRLCAAVTEIEGLVLQRVVVDLDEVRSIDGAGIDFIAELHGRWRVRLLNTPAALRAALPRQACGSDVSDQAIISAMSVTDEPSTSVST